MSDLEQRDLEAEARAAAAVLADAAMQRGDPRGELLALELAAANTRDPIRARRIHRAAQVVRDRYPEQAWPSLPELAMSTRIRAGYLVAAALRGGDQTPNSNPSLNQAAALLDHPAADSLRRLAIGAMPIDSLELVLRRLAERPARLELLELELGDSGQLPAILPRLAALAPRGLRLRLPDTQGGSFGATRVSIAGPDAGWLGSLQALSITGYLDPSSLGPGSQIESLDGWSSDAATLEQIVGLPRLRKLCLRHDGSRDEGGLVPLARARRLEALAVQVGSPDELGVLAELPALRGLALHDPSGRASSFLTGLSRLTRLELRERAPARLDELAGLVGLELLGLRGEPSEPGTLDLSPLAELPRLRALILDTSRHTPRGCDQLHRLRALTVVGRVDLRWFSGTALDELTITHALAPPSLPRLSELGPLRRLRMPGRVLQGIDGTRLARLLPELEELELVRAPATLSPDQFAGFPRLRRLVVDGVGRARARFFAEELPEIMVETLGSFEDSLGLAAAFDWRGASWPEPPLDP